MTEQHQSHSTEQPATEGESGARGGATLRSLSWLERLVGLDTTSRASNRELIDVVADECRRLGLEPHVLPDTADDKANLVVTVPDHQGNTSGGVVVSGHTDVVPVDGQDWESDPFTVREADGRLYGRGVCDMKGYIAAFMEALPRFVETPLNEPLHLALTYDEELACLGGAEIVKQIPELGLTPRLALVGEPTSMRVVESHKSMVVVAVRFTGVPSHSSLPAQGVNAIEYAAELVLFLRSLADAWVRNGPFDDGFGVPYTTLSVNEIDGGTAQNIVPSSCVLTFEFRSIAEVSPDDVVAEVTAEAERIGGRMSRDNPQAGVEVTVLSRVPGLVPTGSGQAAGMAEASGGIVPGPKVTYGTEAGLYAETGVDAIVCGPGDIAQAHTPNEWVTIDQLLACEEYFEALRANMTA